MKLSDYHQHQLAFVGHSGTGKTTLLEKLMLELSHEYRLGYAKHDGHGFQMDREGKDSARLYKAGAQTVSIESSQERARRSHPDDSFPRPLLFSDCDAVLIEGHKDSPYPKILVLSGPEDPLLNAAKCGTISNIVATVSPDVRPMLELPHFQRDQISALREFILARWLAPENCAPLYGLVLAGGRSQRMASDKSQLIYQNKPQAEHLLSLMQEACGKHTYVSCREDQSFTHPRIVDRFIDMGPVGGILSAMLAHPQAAWLVVAVDMPFVTGEALQGLVQVRQALKVATAYLNPENRLPEPLMAIYEPKARATLMQFLGWDIRCPRKVLLNCNASLLECPEPKCLENANTPEDFSRFKEELDRQNIK